MLSEEAKKQRAAYMKKWRDENKDKVNEYQRAWGKQNADKKRQYNVDYWERKSREMASQA